MPSYFPQTHNNFLSSQKRELQEKIKQRRKEREEHEQKEAREREKKRIQMGQAIAERKRAVQEMEMKKLAEERRREKIEDKIARQKVKEQIERDRQARKEMDARKSNVEVTAAAQIHSTVADTAPPAQKKAYATTRLQ
ncbi:hypothetical protein SK128_021576, partial [Halocaridina rubra]